MAGEKTIKLVPEVDREACKAHFQAKVQGTYALSQVLKNHQLDFVLLFSSNVSVLGGLGSTAYAAANLFMDAFATTCPADQRWLSANWDGWLTTAGTSLGQGFQTSIDQYAMQPDESVEAFRRVVTAVTTRQVIVSTGHLPARLDLWINRAGNDDANESKAHHPRPNLNTEYVPPENELQELIVTIWQQLLGIEQLGIHDNFFDLGGNSLIALKVIAQLKKELHFEIPVVSLFEGPTAHALAAVLGQQQNGQQPLYDASHSRGERRRQRRQHKQV
jgi:acyl carrier protein